MLSLVMISCGLLAQIDVPEQPELAKHVAKLVRQLDDDQWGRRQNAEKTLLKMGPNILEVLPHDAGLASPEAKQRLARVRNQLQVEFASRAVEASRVTLRGTMTLAAALESLQEQTGNVIVGYDDVADQNITVDVQQVAFWKAFDQVLDQAKMTLYPYAGEGAKLRVMQRDDGLGDRAKQAYYEGVFRIQPTYVSAARDLLHPAIKGLRVRLSVAWEPRTKPIAITLPLDEISVRDNRGRPIPVDGEGGRLNAAVESDVPMVDMEVPLTLPDRNARSIASLQGTFEVMIPGQIETFTLAGLEKQAEQKEHRAGVTVTLRDVRKNEDVQEVRVHIQFDEASNALESHRGWIFKNDAYMTDASGQRIEQAGRRLISQDEDSIFVGFMFVLDQPLADCKFVYRTPSLIIRQPMRFELKDIDLP